MNIAGARRSTRLRREVTTSADGGPATHANHGGVQGPRMRLPVAAAAATGSTMEFTGTALYNNDSMDGPNKTRARSRSAADIVSRSNQFRGKDWLEFQTFEVTQDVRDQLSEFEKSVRAKLQGTMKKERFQGIDADVLQSPQIISTYAENGDLLMLSVDIHELWPTMDTDQCHLYGLARQILPKHNRSKDPIRVEYMHSFGVKQLGLSDTTDNSILLKMVRKNDESVSIYSEFREAAVLFYGKQEALERVIAPDNHAVRKQLRDQQRANSCCAIPGAEELITACACTPRPCRLRRAPA